MKGDCVILKSLFTTRRYKKREFCALDLEVVKEQSKTSAEVALHHLVCMNTAPLAAPLHPPGLKWVHLGSRNDQTGSSTKKGPASSENAI